jgi:hypothetical protein
MRGDRAPGELARAVFGVVGTSETVEELEQQYVTPFLDVLSYVRPSLVQVTIGSPSHTAGEGQGTQHSSSQDPLSPHQWVEVACVCAALQALCGLLRVVATRYDETAAGGTAY